MILFPFKTQALESFMNGSQTEAFAKNLNATENLKLRATLKSVIKHKTQCLKKYYAQKPFIQNTCLLNLQQ